VGEERWFVRGDEEWLAMAERLKQTPCPHCKVVGALIRHVPELSSERRVLVAARIRQIGGPGFLPSTPLKDPSPTPPVPRCPHAARISIFGEGRSVGEERWFSRGAEEWLAMAERLKQTPCPHCKTVGALIRHGVLYGFDDSSPRRKTVRARRIFCSNRHARPGCGRTFSVWLADKVRRLSLTAGALWRFLQAAVAGGILAAGRAVDYRLSERTWQRIWRRFDQGQSTIRTALCGRCPPPELLPRPPAKPALQPAAQVLAHLVAAFPDAHCPIAAFQQTMHAFFM
jgi:hypothetical protein